MFVVGVTALRIGAELLGPAEPDVPVVAAGPRGVLNQGEARERFEEFLRDQWEREGDRWES